MNAPIVNPRRLFFSPVFFPTRTQAQWMCNRRLVHVAVTLLLNAHAEMKRQIEFHMSGLSFHRAEDIQVMSVAALLGRIMPVMVYHK
jgi:hypothetical protein